jgi:hypothetical protein
MDELTPNPRSTRVPTAGRQAREVPRRMLHLAGLAARRWDSHYIER